MPAKTRSESNVKATLARTFLAAGGVVLLGFLGLSSLEFRAFLDNFLTDAPGSFIAFGLASLHLVQSAAFDHGAMFWLAAKVLLLCSAFGLVVAGLALLRNSAASAVSASRPYRPTLRNGDQ